MSSLDRLRARADYFMAVCLWTHTPGMTLLSWIVGQGWLGGMIAAGLAAIMPPAALPTMVRSPGH